MAERRVVCTACGVWGWPTLPGSSGVEAVLWVVAILFSLGSCFVLSPFVLLPLGYSIWRRVANGVCSACHNSAVLADTLPEAGEVWRRFHPAAPVEVVCGQCNTRQRADAGRFCAKCGTPIPLPTGATPGTPQ